MKRIKMLGMALVALVALSAVASSAAFAGEGPHWVTSSGRLTETLTVSGSGGAQKLAAESESVECSSVSSTGTVFNTSGLAGKDTAEIAFTGCKVFKGKKFTTELPGCSVTNVGGTAGTIDVDANTELVFATKKDAEEETGTIYDLFSPTSGEKFVELDFTGSECVVTGEVEVKGSVLAEPSTAVSTSGTLTFPTTAITKGFVWPGDTEVKVGLKVFGFSAIQSGVTTVTSATAYGVSA